MLKLIYYLIPINIIIDIGLFFTGYGSYLSFIRFILYFLIILYSLIKYDFNRKYINLLLYYSIYILLMLFFVRDIDASLKISLKILFSMLSFLIGYIFINNEVRLSHLNSKIFLSIFLLIINFVISTIFKIGSDTYTGSQEFLVGNYDDNWNVFTYLLIISPLVIKQYYQKKVKLTILVSLYLILLLLTILSMKRIAIIGTFFGLSIYFFLNFKILNYIKYIIIIIIILYLLYPFYNEILYKRYEARKDKYEISEENLETEARFIESTYVWNQIFSFNDPLRSFFGLEAFNSINNYGDRFIDRNLHVDYNLIANTTGLFGLFFYLYIYFIIIKNINLYKKKSIYYNISELKVYYTLCYSLIFTSLITSFAGQMYAMTFRTIIFLYLGAMFKIIENRIGYESSRRM